MDDKRLKRILANRQSAARSKEKKIIYVKELETKVERLRTVATNMSEELVKHERETAYLAACNKDLKIKIEAKIQQAHLKQGLNKIVKEDIERLREQNIHMAAINGNQVLFNHLVSVSTMQHMTNPPPHQLQFGMPPPQQPQFGMPPPQQPQLGMPPHPSYQPFNGQYCPNFMDFNQH